MSYATALEDKIKNFYSLSCDQNFSNTFVLNEKKIGSPVAVASEYFTPDLYTYSYNKHNFRSIEFSSDVDILTAGCSFTFGMGLPFEYTWSQQLQKQLPNKKIATLSWPGYSIQKIISYIFRYFKSIGHPKMIICNFPDFYRFLFLNKYNYGIMNYYSGILQNPSFSKKIKKQIEESCPSDYWGYYINYEYIFMLEQYCDSNNIKLIWSTWSNVGSNKNEDRNFFYSVFPNGDLKKEIVKDENFKNTFKYFYQDYESLNFYKLNSKILFDKNGKIKYLDKKNMDCHHQLKNETEDFFEVAYDRYTIPEKDRDDMQKHLKMSRSERDKNLNRTNSIFGGLGHFGSHRNIHWAEFYFNIIKQNYPEFI
jgi:hypothetical protein